MPSARPAPALPRIAGAGLADGTVVQLACDDRGAVSVALERAPRGAAARLVERGAIQGAICIVGAEEQERAGDPSLHGEVAPGFARPGQGGPCLSDASVFAQATRFGARAILEAVLAAAAPRDGQSVLELFAGSGHLTVPLLAHGARVTAVEGAPRAVSFLASNVRGAEERCEVRHGFIGPALEVPQRVETLVADPPRTGIPGFDALLRRARPATLVLVSCDPATGARDLSVACAAGYGLDWLQPIDAFPRTSHVEWVARLVRAPAADG